jgi:thiamine biosynthesis lipoprotein
MKRRKLLYVFVFVFFTNIFGCGLKVYHDSLFSMGTVVEVTSSDPRAAKIVFAEFGRLEKIFNLFDDQSELSRLNLDGEVLASSDFYEVLKVSRDYFVQTEGFFDISIGPVSLLWKNAIQKSQMPEDAKVKEALSFVGFNFVYLDENKHFVKLLKDGAKLDCGGIVKGVALDKAVLKLKQAGVREAMIDAGGDLYCLGRNRSRPWRIGVQDPKKPKHIIKSIPLENTACATSGDYEQFFIFKDKRYSHIIDPKTGYPADSEIVSATIIASSAVTAVVLAKVCVLVGAAKSFALLEKFKGCHAIIVLNDGTLREKRT